MKIKPGATIRTTRATYLQYVDAGLWAPTTKVKWHKNPGTGIVTCNVMVKSGNDCQCQVLIEKFFQPVK